MSRGAGDVSTADVVRHRALIHAASQARLPTRNLGKGALALPDRRLVLNSVATHPVSPPRPLIARNGSTSSIIADAAAQVASSHSLASLNPPHYDDLTPPKAPPPPPPALHPRIAVLLGVSTSWHIPLLIARALSTAPAMWWGLRCALTFLGDLLLSDGMGDPGDPWTVEKRFRVTEVFLAILWVIFLLTGFWARG